MKGRKMSFQRIFLPVIFLPGFQSDRSEAFFNLIIQVEIFCGLCAFSWLDQGKPSQKRLDLEFVIWRVPRIGKSIDEPGNG